MKILEFCPYYPPHIGGLENHADEFNKYLSQKGMDITVFTPRLPKDASEFETRYQDVKIIRFPAFEIISNYPLPKFWSLKFWRMSNSLFGKKFDIVFSHTKFFNTSLLAFFYSKKTHTKWIHIEHGSNFSKLDNPLLNWIPKVYEYTLGKLVLKYCDECITISNAVKEFSKRIYTGKDYHVIYRGMDYEKIDQILPQCELKNKYTDETIITFVGRLIDGKGVVDLIKAFAGTKRVDIKLFIVGDGTQKKRLENLSEELKIENKVIFLGYKKFEDAIGILKISDIFVNPSYTEGLPTSVMEAALCKKAIIATDVGGTNEIITDQRSGFLIRPNDILILREKLEILISDIDLRKKFGMEAYTEVIEKFNWENATEKYLKIIQAKSERHS